MIVSRSRLATSDRYAATRRESALCRGDPSRGEAASSTADGRLPAAIAGAPSAIPERFSPHPRGASDPVCCAETDGHRPRIRAAATRRRYATNYEEL
jgi:hypothetical protein